jgi:hypothetical protein
MSYGLDLGTWYAGTPYAVFLSNVEGANGDGVYSDGMYSLGFDFLNSRRQKLLFFFSSPHGWTVASLENMMDWRRVRNVRRRVKQL